MRHPLPISRREGQVLLSVGGVDLLVVRDAEAPAVPADFQPTVAEGAQGGVVAAAGGDLDVVEGDRGGVGIAVRWAW